MPVYSCLEQNQTASEKRVSVGVTVVPEMMQSRLPLLVENAVGIICEKYDCLCGIEELARELGVSKSHLVREFSKATGISPGRYYTIVRIEAAKQRLLSKAYPLETVAVLSGFSGANYFCKVFKKSTGMTPGEYRRLYADYPGAHRETEMEKRLYL